MLLKQEVLLVHDTVEAGCHYDGMVYSTSLSGLVGYMTSGAQMRRQPTYSLSCSTTTLLLASLAAVLSDSHHSVITDLGSCCAAGSG